MNIYHLENKIYSNSTLINVNKTQDNEKFYTIFQKINIKHSVGTYIAKNILFAKNKNENYQGNQQIKHFLISTGQVEQFHIKASHEHVQLDGIILKPNQNSDKYILVFNGINDCYDNHIVSLNKLADDTGANVVSFDYRGINHSLGKICSKNSLVIDGQIILDFLKNKKNAAGENILLYGHSLGGAVAAELHAKVGHRGPLLPEAAFRSFADAVAARKGRIAGLLVKYANWDLQTLKPFQRAAKKGIIFTRRDPIILDKISLAKSLKKKSSITPITRAYQVIKIGKNPQKETLHPHVKVFHRSAYKTTPSKPTLKKETAHSHFQKRMSELKRLGLYKFLVHPHDRVMDRISYRRPDLQQNSTLPILKQKFLREDELAYQHMVEMMKRLLKSTPSLA